MKYFRYYLDDTLQPVTVHGAGELVGRKPVVLDLSKRRHVKHRQAVSTRMGKEFVKRLTRIGNDL